MEARWRQAVFALAQGFPVYAVCVSSVCTCGDLEVDGCHDGFYIEKTPPYTKRCESRVGPVAADAALIIHVPAPGPATIAKLKFASRWM